MSIELLKFDISGRNAHFKNPENNLQIEITFEHIPKTVVLGMLGAIIGLNGRGQERFLGKIEWWEELKDVEISIVPGLPRWRKFIDETTNTTGFANKKDNQILRRQYIENPRWTIYIKKSSIKDVYWQKLKYNLEQNMSEYRLYLGQTNHQAFIHNVELVYGEKMDLKDVEGCDSLFKHKYLVEIEESKRESDYGVPYESIQYYPIALNELGMYIKERLVYTNRYMQVNCGDFYTVDNRILSFI